MTHFICSAWKYITAKLRTEMVLEYERVFSQGMLPFSCFRLHFRYLFLCDSRVHWLYPLCLSAACWGSASLPSPCTLGPIWKRGIVIKTNTSCMTLMACSNFHTFSFGISQFFLRSRFVAALLVLCMLTGESAGPESFWIYQVLGRLSLKCIFWKPEAIMKCNFRSWPIK